jgi:hypothetical protein
VTVLHGAWPQWFAELPDWGRFVCGQCGAPYCVKQRDTGKPFPGGCDGSPETCIIAAVESRRSRIDPPPEPTTPGLGDAGTL